MTVTTREDAERIVTKQAPQDVRRVEELDTDGQVIREFGVGDGIEWDRIVWSQCDRLAR
ncbi:MAG: hypothetical protein OXI12_14000 [Gammaproteobacteria bacterium]|nr:hypothetical protein [Gammaproteobacteria bacterium]